MNWVEKIKQGLALIGEGCRDADSYDNCPLCPLYKICEDIDDAALRKNLPIIMEWWEEK